MSEKIVLDRMWEQISVELPNVSREQFEKIIKDFQIVPFWRDDVLCAVVVANGPYLHFMTFGARWNVTRDILRQYPGSLIERYGYAETFTPIHDKRQQRFNEHIGFFEQKRDKDFIYYRIERMRI